MPRTDNSDPSEFLKVVRKVTV